MIRLFDLSFRSKIPLWGGFLMVLTSLIVSASLLVHAYDELKQDMRASSESLGRALANMLFQTLLHDDVWRAYELIDAPIRGAQRGNPMQAETLLVVNVEGQIVVSTDPKKYPMLTDIARLDEEYAHVAADISGLETDSTRIAEVSGPDHFYFIVPIASEDKRLGTLILTYSRSVFLHRFLESVWRTAVIGFLIMAVLLPMNWYWGRRMAVPLMQLAQRMERLAARPLPDDIDPALYPYRDELGKLFEAYRLALHELREKALLEKEIVRSERLAAVGHVAAGIAHEINNPLAGMLTAINTLKHHGDHNPRTLKTVALIERGLLQIKETVAALLVEAKVNSRQLSQQDIDDVRTLVEPQAQKKLVEIEYRGRLETGIPLPATLLRQIFMNLLLNAVQAADERGLVWCEISIADSELKFEVGNNGRQITQEQREHLFEPFRTHHESGHGLGLWVTYQIMQQLGGRIVVSGDGGITRFVVHIPLAVKERTP